jgi:hypothetical protein
MQRNVADRAAAGVAIQFLAASLPVVSNMLGKAAIPIERWPQSSWARFSPGGCLR